MLGLPMINVRAADSTPAPAAEKKPVFNEYHGTKVEDDYQWLENDDDAAVKSVVGRGKQANTHLSRRTVGSERDREATHRMVRENVAELFCDRGPAGEIVRDEVSAAQATADARDFDFGGRFEIGKGAGRSKQDRQ